MLFAARSTPNLSVLSTDDTEMDSDAAAAKLNQKSDKDSSATPAVTHVPALEADWLTSFFARRPITDVDRHDVTVHDFDAVASCSATA